MDLKTRIMRNKFVERLRMELVIDENEYELLCKALKELAQEWQSKNSIDKELAGDLYVLVPIARNMAEDVARARGGLAVKHKVEEMATELDALVIECFQTPK